MRPRAGPAPAGSVAGDVDPLAALNRIAYLLESQGAPAFKFRAFRRAAETVRATDPEVLAQLAVPSRLATLANVGDTTAAVIAEALAGEVPSYLATLEQAAVNGDAAQVLALRALLRGDCHSHSDWSDGKNPIEEMAGAARALGHDYLVLTDHSGSLSIANGLEPDRLRRQLEVVAELNDELAPFRILTGIEVDILADGRLDQEDELLATLDVVVASCHSRLREDAGLDDQAARERRLGPETSTSSATRRTALSPGAADRSPSSIRKRSSARAPRRGSRSRSTAAPNATTHRRTSSRSPSAPGARSRSIPTRTAPANSNGWRAAAARPSTRASRRHRS